jgi:hypothetical protein
LHLSLNNPPSERSGGEGGESELAEEFHGVFEPEHKSSRQMKVPRWLLEARNRVAGRSCLDISS